MQARRGIARALSCALGLLLLTAVHAGAQPRHPVRAVALVAPAGAEAPHSWRWSPDDALTADADRTVVPSTRTDTALALRQLDSRVIRTVQARGPPGSALA